MAMSNTAKSKRLTQAERSEYSTQRLLEAATELIAEQGYSCTTIPQIAQKAGYSHGLVTQRFGSKGELIETLAKRFHDYFRAERLVPAIKQGGGRETLVIMTDAYIDAVVSSDVLGRAYYQLYGESIMLGPEIHDTFVRADRDFRRALQSVIERDELPRRVNPHTLATLILSILRGFAMQWMRDSTLDPEAIKDEIRFLLENVYSPTNGTA